jgi:hypothetical protein
MHWWLLLLIITLTWCLWAIAAVAQKSAIHAAKGLPMEQCGGISIAPVIPVFPAALFGIAKLTDLFVAPWGTWSVGGLHILLMILFVISIARDWLRLQAVARRR